MVKVLAQGKTFYSRRGANLRQVLLENNIDLYNGGATIISGTCAVEVVGEISEVNWRFATRRSLPHSPTRNFRLACQTQVLGDISVTKFDLFWGQGNQIWS